MLQIAYVFELCHERFFAQIFCTAIASTCLLARNLEIV